MGQYYIPTLIADDGTVSTLYSHQYDNGLKLMEHSYIGNRFVNAVLTQIWEHPKRIAWIGDYSDTECGDPYERKLPYAQFMEYYNVAWGENRETARIHPTSKAIVDMDSNAYLINHTQRQYIDLAEYIAANKWHEEGTWAREHYTYDMCVHPLPLLTACGNGRGGGDYHECYPDYDKVGIWAFDLIECSARRPDEYEKILPEFTEQRKAA